VTPPEWEVEQPLFFGELLMNLTETEGGMPSENWSDSHAFIQLEGPASDLSFRFDSSFSAELPFAPVEYVLSSGFGRVHVGPYAVDTIPGGTSTLETIGTPGSRTSAIDTPGDQDWFRVTLSAGVTYSFALTGVGDILDPFLSLYDASGSLIVSDDDSGPGLNSWIVSFTPSVSGTYFLGASGFTVSTGTYVLETFILGGSDNIPGDTGTTETLIVNGPSASSSIEFSGDEDWFRITLVEGQSYAFSLSASGGTPIPDAFLSIHNAAGQVISIDDDGGAGLDSMMQFTATASGTYYLSAAGFDVATGDYTISAVAGPPQDPLHTLSLGFTFPNSAINVYFALMGEDFGPAGAALRNWTPEERAAVMSALETIANVTNLTFTESATSVGAQFILVLSDLGPGVLGQTWVDDVASGIAYIEFAPDGLGWSTGALQVGGLSYATVIHEAGHALGMDHPHYDGGDMQIMQGVLSEFDSYGTFQLNQAIFTVMSYNDGWPLGPTAFPRTSMSAMSLRPWRSTSPSCKICMGPILPPIRATPSTRLQIRTRNPSTRPSGT
jgi:hypothetical protein